MPLFRVIAIDYDGTLTLAERPDADVLDAVAELRENGIRVVLCTGRILDELLGVFPDAAQWFDGMVLENGAVQWTAEGGLVSLAPPLDPELARLLRARGVELRTGRVLLATRSRWAHEVLEQTERLGLDCQLIRNRDALMVLPGGVTKGTGLFALLGDLGFSFHNAIGIGDAENDHALLDRCELGVAVANAVPALAAHADVVLAEPNGTGVLRFLRGPILRGEVRVRPRRWRAEIGRHMDGSIAAVPGSGVNVLVSGQPASGKSYLAGMLAERLVALGYSLVIFDPEGDHGALSRHRGVLTLGGRKLPGPADLAVLLDARFLSLVVDLSGLEADAKRDYYRQAMERIVPMRARTGRPHWIFLDEADQLLGGDSLPGAGGSRPPSGFCLTTYRPEALAPDVWDALDVRIQSVRAGDEVRHALAASEPKPTDPMFERALEGAPFLGFLEDDSRRRAFLLAARESPHIRHWHKYVSGSMPWHRRFHFRNAHGSAGRSAGNVVEFADALADLDGAVIRHHLHHGDFSRWFEEVLRDRLMADRLRRIEHEARAGAGMDVLREQLADALEQRYRVKS